jgi:hypothetical protein
MTNKSVKSITFLPKDELRVKDVLNMIIHNGRDKYIFTEEGEGCRFWICTVIKDLEVAGKLDKDSAVVAVHTLGYYWVSSSEGTDREMEAGQFF